jgi:hypothetical protein
VRRKLDGQACLKAKAAAPPELVLEPCQMIIQMDAWNIREGDQWGQTGKLRRAGQEPERWHWMRQRLGWTTAAARAGENPSAAEPSNQPAGRPNAALSAPANTEANRKDEALLCLETFWRNDRWHLLFPHHRRFDLSKN